MNPRHSTVPTPRTAPPLLAAALFVAALLAGCGGTRPEAPPQEPVAPLPPARVDPVKETMSTSGCEAIAAPTPAATSSPTVSISSIGPIGMPNFTAALSITGPGMPSA